MLLIVYDKEQICPDINKSFPYLALPKQTIRRPFLVSCKVSWFDSAATVTHLRDFWTAFLHVSGIDLSSVTHVTHVYIVCVPWGVRLASDCSLKFFLYQYQMYTHNLFAIKVIRDPYVYVVICMVCFFAISLIITALN